MLRSIYRMFLRVLPRAGYSRFGLYGVHPRRSLGGAGGPAAPFRGVRGDTPPESCSVKLTYSYGSFDPLPVGGGLLGEGHTGRLLDLPVWTDTKGGSLGGSGGCPSCGDPLHLVRCDSCGLPLQKCTCIAGRDY